jgi:hypothetical protein
MTKKEYFFNLASYARELLSELPIEKEPQPLKFALNILHPKINEIAESEIKKIKAILPHNNTISAHGNTNKWQGLNSIGMLIDRFTILIIREWCLRNKSNGSGSKADEIFEQQTSDIIEAMTHAAPGSASLNSKITNIKSKITANSWEEAFYGILTINLILWEAQEVLYIKDIQAISTEEIRDYISWFSKGNIIRNEYIQLCEEYFWKISDK